ncbi:carbohydrate ABC transporter permease [Bifidobacterium aquikefiri]|uniref:carbohydrate ABC transporter permease n=1 Tax=Bifidobacterium aquikefiri TaxID=1653207 RepID=UPI0023F1C0EF|nr:sugar ABC transporter permease [Bifidobacterium aquikefiri]
MKRKDWYWNLLFVGPTVCIFSLVVLVPFVMGISYSFVSWDGIAANAKRFIGFTNYVSAMSDTRFIRSAVKTFIFTAGAVVLTNALGLIVALLVTSKMKFAGVVRTFYFMPYLIGGLILGYIWKFIFSDGFAIIGNVTGWKFIFFNWLLNPTFALFALIFVSTWQTAGYVMIIYISGIQTIPQDLIEAAEVDGAHGWKLFWHVKFPLIMPAFTISLFMTLSNSFKIFDTNLSLTAGGPSNATELFAMNIYNEIFLNGNYGYGQAKAVLFFIIVAIFTLVQVSITKKREVGL